MTRDVKSVVVERGTNSDPLIYISTDYGLIVIELFGRAAPLTVTNFLRYLDLGLYTGSTFYRSLRPDNGHRAPRLSLIQGGIDPSCRNSPLAPIAHESTPLTGLSHRDGALSMARWEPGTAASEFFIVIGDGRALDAGGSFGAGYAVFGQVIGGMEIVRAIGEQGTVEDAPVPYLARQWLRRPVPIRLRVEG